MVFWAFLRQRFSADQVLERDGQNPNAAKLCSCGICVDSTLSKNLPNIYIILYDVQLQLLISDNYIYIYAVYMYICQI